MEENLIHTFEKIYGSESDAIFRFCLVRVSNREQALDITQETFLRLWQNLSGDKEIKNNRAFLFTVANHLIIDWYRKKKSFSLDSLLENKETEEYDIVDEKAESNILLGTEGRYLLEKLKELMPIHQNPIYLRFIEDLSPQEIGNILGISANAASVRINRGLIELRKKTGYDSNII
jgi:RNA polymerase sigma-70 factor (ECF subfamily)